MATDKPLISILMAVYEPRMDWLKEQLDSLNAQTYPNLRLYIRDDCSPTAPLEEIKALAQECITAFPYSLERNEKNLGSNGTFELLTREAEGEYFAYCDQDDVWLPEKLTVLQEAIEREQAKLVCSDMYIIDGTGKQVANSITKIRRHHIFRSGVGLTDTLWYSNFASGCALLVRAEIAKTAIPFNPHMYYDHYLTLSSANVGKIISLPTPLIRHREHGENQSSILQGVTDRESYFKMRVERPTEAVIWLEENFPADEKLGKILMQGRHWMEARRDYFGGNRECRSIIWKYRRYSPMASLFEILMPYMPNALFKLCLLLSKKNLI